MIRSYTFSIVSIFLLVYGKLAVLNFCYALRNSIKANILTVKKSFLRGNLVIIHRNLTKSETQLMNDAKSINMNYHCAMKCSKPQKGLMKLW